MGGFGSGRRKYAQTPTVRECRHLAADDFTDTVDRPGSTTVVTWGDRDDPKERIAVKMLPDDADARLASALLLAYTVTTTWTSESSTQTDVIPLEYTACHFGGSRPWFQCPDCDDRRGKLYRPPDCDLFRCRECYELGYESSRTSHDSLKQAVRRYRCAHRRLTGDPKDPFDGPIIPDRPKGMHLSTYLDHYQELADAYAAVDDALSMRAGAMADMANVESRP